MKLKKAFCVFCAALLIGAGNITPAAALSNSFIYQSRGDDEAGGITESTDRKGTYFYLTKKVKVREYSPEPVETYEFEITAGEAYGINDGLNPTRGTDSAQPILAGRKELLGKELEGFTFLGRFGSAAEVSYGSNDSSALPKYLKYDAQNNEYIQAIPIKIYDSYEEFGSYVEAEPGIYHYQVREKVKTSDDQWNPSNDGMVYSTEVYDLYFYKFAPSSRQDSVIVAMKNGKEVNSEDSSLLSHYSSIDTAQNLKAKSTIEFTNEFHAKSGDNGTRTIQLVHQIDGNMSDPNQYFKYTFRVDSSKKEGVAEGYTFAIKDSNGFVSAELSNSNLTVESTDSKTSDGKLIYPFRAGDKVTIQLKKGETVEIYGLSPNDHIYTSEYEYTDGSEKPAGYTSAVQYQIGSQDSVTNKSEIVDKLSDDAVITWTQTKNVKSPTGLMMTWAPYIGLTALAGVGFYLFAKHRKED